MDQLKNKAKGAQGQLDNTAGSAKGAGAAAAFLGKASKGAVPGVAALGTALKAALGPIAVLTSAAGALTSAFSTLAQQDFAEAKVRTLGVNSEELKGRLSDVSRELSGQASVVELTAAAYDVASAGFNDAASAAQVLKASSLAATGGFSDLNTVADATTSVLNAYGLGAEEASRITDQFIQTQNDGKIVIGQYAANIAKVAPVASALGIGLDEINASVAQITGTGTNAEVTFTALKTAFAQLASGAVGEKLKDFGVNIDANTIAADGFIGTLEKIQESGADTGAILKAFGTEAGPVLQPLLNNTDKLNKLLENQRNAQGAAAKAAFEASDTINGALKRLQTAFTNIFADGSELGLLLKGTFQVAAVTVEALGAALKLVLAPTRGLIDAATKIYKAFLPIDEGVSIAFELEKAWQSVLGAIDTLTNGVTAFFSVFAQTIPELIGVVIDFGKNINEALGNPVGRLIELYGQWSNFVLGVFGQIAEAAGSFFTGFVGGAGQAVTKVVEFFGGLFSELAKIIKGFEDFLPGWLKDSLSGATGAAKNVVNAIGTAVSSVKEIVEAVPEKIATTFTAQAVSGKATETAAAANSIQQTGGGLAKPPGETTTTKKSDLQKQQEAAAKLVQKLTRKNELDALGTEEARKLKELEFAKLDIAAQFPLLKQEEIEKLQNLLQENYNISEEKRKQKELDDQAKKNADDLQKKLDEQKKKQEEIADAIRSNITSAIMEAIDGTKTLGQAFTDLLKKIGNMALEIGISSLLKSIKFADGGVINKGKVTPFAAGGVLNKPTLFPMANGMGLAGEAGPEAIMPLKRGPGGRLGVEASGGSSIGGIVVNVDASNTSAEGDTEQGKQLGKVIGIAVRSEILKQQRPGGLLA